MVGFLEWVSLNFVQIFWISWEQTHSFIDHLAGINFWMFSEILWIFQSSPICQTLISGREMLNVVMSLNNAKSLVYPVIQRQTKALISVAGNLSFVLDNEIKCNNTNILLSCPSVHCWDPWMGPRQQWKLC